MFMYVCLLQLIHTFLAQDSALIGPRTKLQALTVSITLYSRLRLRYSVVKETCNLLFFLFKLVILCIEVDQCLCPCFLLCACHQKKALLCWSFLAESIA